MSVSFVVVPQWQGSVSARAMRLGDGAEAIREDLPASRTSVVDVPAEAGTAEDSGIHRYSALLTVRQRLAGLLAAQPAGQHQTDECVLTIGGDCGVSLAAVEAASLRYPHDLAVVWFDAHPDLHTPTSSPSGAFTGMVLRAITGDGAEGLALGAEAVPPERVVLAGARDVDPPEADWIAEHALACLDPEQLAERGAVLGAVRETGASRVYLHIDLDVLDPAVLSGLANPVPFGLSVDALTAAITMVRSEFTLAGATIAGFSPASPDAAGDDMSAILRIIGALTR